MNHAPSSRRSFFGLNLGKSPSNESQYSIMSDDNHHVHNNQNNAAAANNNSSSNLSSTASSNHVAAPPIQRNGSSSMVQLKKFFRPARKNSNDHIHSPLNHSNSGLNNRRSPHGHSNSNLKSLSQSQNSSPAPQTPSTPTFTHDANNNMIVKTDQKFWDDLEGSVTKKYGKLGKVLGSGAGGSVRLIVRESDGVTFAVKEFVPRRPNESVKEYAKKCTAEFCIGSTLHHPNIIQTLDIINENNHFYEVMEYAPIDFFAVVMSGQMTRSEINCCLKQITLGVSYLHSVGLAHRDLKLDNCVVTKDGIVKLIDFGSAVVFKYPFEEETVKAHGIVGSDPYLAPEVLTSTDNYDPQFVDIWSVAVIYCCMTLRRFPWKAPKKDDPSFSLYCMEDDQPHDYVESARKHKELLIERKKKIVQLQKEKEERENSPQQHQQQQPAPRAEDPVQNVTEKVTELNVSQPAAPAQQSIQHENPITLEDNKLLGDPDKVAVRPKVGSQMDEVTKSVEKKNCDESNENKEKENEHHHHHHHHQEESTTSDKAGTRLDDKGNEVPERRTAGATKSQKQIHGPYRLMRLLPHAARPVISRMLAVKIEDRATMKDILADEWFKEIKYCTIDEEGRTISDPSHHHTIV
ncbi:hypothetical protein PMKS-003436 [Pichia membranifaciens]|uniref:non-specific serine/threonine protein kinase n=1 Tax=Pichia membranifaciens TaxID=4926 RepID=A0A1Q2YK62_9ASCO|nr:hypothetical protein PMKS-003436 [Pichia membranifaciens]